MLCHRPYTTPLGTTAAPPVKDTVSPVREMRVAGSLNGSLTTSRKPAWAIPRAACSRLGRRMRHDLVQLALKIRRCFLVGRALCVGLPCARIELLTLSDRLRPIL